MSSSVGAEVWPEFIHEETIATENRRVNRSPCSKESWELMGRGVMELMMFW